MIRVSYKLADGKTVLIVDGHADDNGTSRVGSTVCAGISGAVMLVQAFVRVVKEYAEAFPEYVSIEEVEA